MTPKCRSDSIHILSSSGVSVSAGSPDPSFRDTGQTASNCSPLGDLVLADTPVMMEGHQEQSVLLLIATFLRALCLKAQTLQPDSQCTPGS